MSKMHVLRLSWYVAALLMQFAIGPAVCANTLSRLLLETFTIIVTWAALTQSVYLLMSDHKPRTRPWRLTALILIVILAAAASVGLTFYNIHSTSWQCLL